MWDKPVVAGLVAALATMVALVGGLVIVFVVYFSDCFMTPCQHDGRNRLVGWALMVLGPPLPALLLLRVLRVRWWWATPPLVLVITAIAAVALDEVWTVVAVVGLAAAVLIYPTGAYLAGPAVTVTDRAPPMGSAGTRWWDGPVKVELIPWSEGDLGLLRQINAPIMKAYLGGPETERQVLDRHRKYVDLPATGIGAMFRVVLAEERHTVGTIGYWEREWQGETVWETGWSVLPEFQGLGLAAEAARAVAVCAAADGRHRWLHAYPKVEHHASNSVCRKAGFELAGVCDFEFPEGNPIVCNDWRLDLLSLRT